MKTGFKNWMFCASVASLGAAGATFCLRVELCITLACLWLSWLFMASYIVQWWNLKEKEKENENNS